MSASGTVRGVDFEGDGVASCKMSVAWWCNTTNLQNAAVRIRAALVMRMLTQRGVAASWFDLKQISRYQCVVVRMRYDDSTLIQLRRFKNGGGKVVLDLCDNHFVPASQEPKHLHQVDNLRSLAVLADAIVTSSASLAEIVKRESPQSSRVITIGDVPDDLSIVEAPQWRRWWTHWKMRREHAFLQRAAPPETTRLVWFGTSGGRRQLAGMVDLARIAPVLAELGKSHPLHLTVISNSHKRYREQVAPLVPASRYIAWDPWTFESLLRRQHIALIPAKANAYTVCKTDNRVVTALRAGLAVVADPVPSYGSYAGLISIGDMEGGLQRYLRDPATRMADASRGKVKAEQPESADRVIAQWLELLENLA